jgi:hypothetical protein
MVQCHCRSPFFAFSEQKIKYFERRIALANAAYQLAMIELRVEPVKANEAKSS